MKQIVLVAVTIYSVLFFNACRKGSAFTTAIILGKWNVIDDSGFKGVGSNNQSTNYTGQAGDYFDFRNDSTIYTKEGSVLDTLSYHLVSGNTIIISSFGIITNGVPETSNISNLTDHSITITAPSTITPGGVFGRTVNLSK